MAAMNSLDGCLREDPHVPRASTKEEANKGIGRRGMGRCKIQGTPPPLLAEPQQIVFEHFTVGALCQKKLVLRNTSARPAVVLGLQVAPSNGQLRATVGEGWSGGKGRQGQWPVLVAPGMSLPIAITFAPDCLDEFHGQLRVIVHGRQGTRVDVRVQRHHPRLLITSPCGQSHLTEKHLVTQKLVSCNVLDCGCCLNGSKINCLFRMENVGGSGSFLMLKNNFLWEDIDAKASLRKENDVAMDPFRVRPCAFSVQRESELILTNEFAPTKSGTYITNLNIASDNGGVERVIVKGDSLVFEPHLVSIQDCGKSFHVSIEDDEDATHYIDLGKVMPFCEKRKEFIVMNKSRLTLKYRWELREMVTDDPLEQYPYVNSSKMFWYVEPNCGDLETEDNTFCVALSIEDAPIGSYRVVISLIVEGVPDEVQAVTVGMADALGHLLEVEVWAECALPSVSMQTPRALFVPTPLLLERPFVTHSSLSNDNEFYLHCSWTVSEVVRGGEGCGAWWEASVHPPEVTIGPNQARAFEVCVRVPTGEQQQGSVSRRHPLTLAFKCQTWYEACNLREGCRWQGASKRAPGPWARGPLLTLCYCGLVEGARVHVLGGGSATVHHFGIVQSGVCVARALHVRSTWDMVATMGLFKGLQAGAPLGGRNSNGAFSLDTEHLPITGLSTGGVALLQFQPKDEESHRCMVVVRPLGMAVGPSWDFAMVQGKGGCAHTALEPVTSRGAPIELLPLIALWPGMSATLPLGASLLLRNLSLHESLTVSFMWRGPVGADAGLMTASVQPKMGLLKPQEAVDFTVNFLMNASGEVRDYALICDVGKKAVYHVFFRANIKSPRITYVMPEKGPTSFSLDNLVLMGLCDKNYCCTDESSSLVSLWEVFCSTNIISFSDVPSYQEQERTFYMENNSPYTLEFKVKLKNFPGSISSDDKWSRKCCVPVKDAQLEEHYLAPHDPNLSNAVTDAKPSRGTLGPWSTMEVTIQFQSSTWGTYVEEGRVAFSAAYDMESGARVEVPPEHRFICVANVISHPISFPSIGMGDNEMLRFSVVPGAGGGSRQRCLCVWNSSCLPVILQSQVHLEWPSRADDHCGPPFQTTIHHFHPDIFTILRGIERSKGFAMSLEEIDVSIGDILSKEYDCSMEVGLMPPLGPQNDQVFKLSHSVLFIPPHGRRKLTVTFAWDDCLQSCLKFRAVLLGHVYIAPENRKSHCQFLRQQGVHMQPTILVMEATVSTPSLYLRHEGIKSIMQFSMQKLVNDYGNTVKTFEKRIIMENRSYGRTKYEIYVGDPFKISVEHGAQTESRALERNSLECTIPRSQVIELSVRFVVTREIVRQALELYKRLRGETSSTTSNPREIVLDASGIHGGYLDIRRELRILSYNSLLKVIPLQIRLIFPSLSLSQEEVSFGTIPIKTTKKCCIRVENMNDEYLLLSIRVEPFCKVFKVSNYEIKLPPKVSVFNPTASFDVLFQPQNAVSYRGCLVLTLLEGVQPMAIPLSGSGCNDVDIPCTQE